MFTHQKSCVVTEQQRRSSDAASEWNTAVRVCTCVAAWLRACAQVENSDAVKWAALPLAAMVMPPLGSKFAWSSVYSELIASSSSNEGGAFMYSPTGLKEWNSVFRWKSWMEVCRFGNFIILANWGGKKILFKLWMLVSLTNLQSQLTKLSSQHFFAGYVLIKKMTIDLKKKQKLTIFTIYNIF